MTLGVNPWDIYHNGAWYNRDGSGGPLPIGDYDSHAAEHAAMGVAVVTYAWADRPSAALNTGRVIRVSDIGGSAGSRWISDGAYWKPENGRVVLSASGSEVSVSATTAEEVLASYLVPALAVGPNGIVSAVTSWTCNNNANNKILRVRWGSTAGTPATGDQVLNSTLSTHQSSRYWTEIQNRNRLDQQIIGTGSGNSSLGPITGAIATAARDTNSAVLLTITGQKANAGDVLTLERYSIELIVP